MVMRDETNCPMAVIINKMSDQNLGGIYASESQYTLSVNPTHRLSLILCDPRMPSTARTSSGITAANRNTIRMSYESVSADSYE